MLFSTLFLIASAVLAMPIGTSDSNTVTGLEKKENNFYLPDDERLKDYTRKKTEEEPKKYNNVYNNFYLPDDERLNDREKEAEKMKDVDYKFKGSRADTGEFCSIWANAKTFEEVPVECMRPVFCNTFRFGYPLPCDPNPRKFLGDTFSKDAVIAATTPYCASESICRPWEIYVQDLRNI